MCGSVWRSGRRFLLPFGVCRTQLALSSSTAFVAAALPKLLSAATAQFFCLSAA